MAPLRRVQSSMVSIPWHGTASLGPCVHSFHSRQGTASSGPSATIFPFWLAGTLVGILGIVTIHPPSTCYLGTNGAEEWVRSHCAPLNSYVTSSVVAHLVRPHAFLLSKRINAYLLMRGILVGSRHRHRFPCVWFTRTLRPFMFLCVSVGEPSHLFLHTLLATNY